MRKDILAAGGRKATFAGGSGENDIFRNVAPEEPRVDVPAIAPAPIIPKKFIPLGGVLLVRRLVEESACKLIVTDTMEKEQPSEGIVLEVGPGVDIEIGAHVVFGKYAGAQFNLNGETLLLMDYADVKGTIVDEPHTSACYIIPGIARA